MPEDFDAQLSRIRLMAEGDPTWDLSPDDTAALAELLSRWDGLTAAVADGGWDLAPCMVCSRPVICVPEGLAMCVECAAKERGA